MSTVNELGTVWRKSTHSDGHGGDCVEVADVPGIVPVRDSKHPHGPTLVFSTGGWSSFVMVIKRAGLPA